MTFVLNQMVAYGLQIHHMVFYLIMKVIQVNKNMEDVMSLDMILN